MLPPPGAGHALEACARVAPDPGPVRGIQLPHWACTTILVIKKAAVVDVVVSAIDHGVNVRAQAPLARMMTKGRAASKEWLWE